MLDSIKEKLDVYTYNYKIKYAYPELIINKDLSLVAPPYKSIFTVDKEGPPKDISKFDSVFSFIVPKEVRHPKIKLFTPQVLLKNSKLPKFIPLFFSGSLKGTYREDLSKSLNGTEKEICIADKNLFTGSPYEIMEKELYTFQMNSSVCVWCPPGKAPLTIRVLQAMSCGACLLIPRVWERVNIMNVKKFKELGIFYNWNGSDFKEKVEYVLKNKKECLDKGALAMEYYKSNVNKTSCLN